MVNRWRALGRSPPAVVDHFVEIAAHSLYFVTATAYDFRGVEKKEKTPLWPTRMTIEAQGVSLEKILNPLIVNHRSFLGRDPLEPSWITQRLEREGRIDVGVRTVAELAKPGAALDKPDVR